MAQLIRTVNRLLADKLIQKMEPISTECAKVWVTNTHIFTIVIGDDYYGIGITELLEVCRKEPHIDYVVLSDWQEITQAAKEFCQEKGIPVVKLKEFRHILHKILKNEV